MVDSVVTPMTVNTVSRSWLSPFGSTDEMASAAEAPQIATAPAVSRPNGRLRPKARAPTTPKPIVSSTATMTITTGVMPRCMISPMVIWAPSSPTAILRMRLEASSMPAMQRPSCDRK